MQRALVISFTVFYVFLSTGLGVNLHYCQGHFEKLAFIDLDGDICCQNPLTCPAEPEGNKDCCDNQSALLKFSPEHFVVFSNGFDKSNVVGCLPNHDNLVPKGLLLSSVAILPPPATGYSAKRLWLFYCNFTLYS